MDPDANLREQLELAAQSQWIWDECPEDGVFTQHQLLELSSICIRLGELVEALDGWITKGGAYPKRWTIDPGKGRGIHRTYRTEK